MDTIVNILYQTSDFYAPMAGVSILSLLENNKDINHLRLYVLTDDLGENNRLKFDELVGRYNRTITYVKADSIDNILASRGVTKHNGSYAPFYKLFANELISDLEGEKLIYIDADTVVLGSIRELIEYQFDDEPYAIVRVPMYKEYYSMIGITKQADFYPNTGVMVFSRENWKKHNCTERLIEFLKSSSKNKFRAADQDIISIIFDEKIGVLHPKFNVGPAWYFLGIEKFKKIHDATAENFYSDKLLNEAMEQPVICHCLGGMYGRPWEKDNFSPFKEIWQTYKEKSPWNNMDDIPRKKSFIDIAQKIFLRIAPSNIYVFFHKYLMKYQCRKNFYKP